MLNWAAYVTGYGAGGDSSETEEQKFDDEDDDVDYEDDDAVMEQMRKEEAAGVVMDADELKLAEERERLAAEAAMAAGSSSGGDNCNYSTLMQPSDVSAFLKLELIKPNEDGWTRVVNRSDVSVDMKVYENTGARKLVVRADIPYPPNLVYQAIANPAINGKWDDDWTATYLGRKDKYNEIWHKKLTLPRVMGMGLSARDCVQYCLRLPLRTFDSKGVVQTNYPEVDLSEFDAAEAAAMTSAGASKTSSSIVNGELYFYLQRNGRDDAAPPQSGVVRMETFGVNGYVIRGFPASVEDPSAADADAVDAKGKKKKKSLMSRLRRKKNKKQSAATNRQWFTRLTVCSHVDMKGYIPKSVVTYVASKGAPRFVARLEKACVQHAEAAAKLPPPKTPEEPQAYEVDGPKTLPTKSKSWFRWGK